MLNNYPDIMNTDEVCEVLNISKNHCLKLLKDKKILGFKVNEQSRIWKITKPAIIQYITGRPVSLSTLTCHQTNNYY